MLVVLPMLMAGGVISALLPVPAALDSLTVQLVPALTQAHAVSTRIGRLLADLPGLTTAPDAQARATVARTLTERLDAIETALYRLTDTKFAAAPITAVAEHLPALRENLHQIVRITDTRIVRDAAVGTTIEETGRRTDALATMPEIGPDRVWTPVIGTALGLALSATAARHPRDVVGLRRALGTNEATAATLVPPNGRVPTGIDAILASARAVAEARQRAIQARYLETSRLSVLQNQTQRLLAASETLVSTIGNVVSDRSRAIATRSTAAIPFVCAIGATALALGLAVAVALDRSFLARVSAVARQARSVLASAPPGCMAAKGDDISIMATALQTLENRATERDRALSTETERHKQTQGLLSSALDATGSGALVVEHDHVTQAILPPPLRSALGIDPVGRPVRSIPLVAGAATGTPDAPSDLVLGKHRYAVQTWSQENGRSFIVLGDVTAQAMAEHTLLHAEAARRRIAAAIGDGAQLACLVRDVHQFADEVMAATVPLGRQALQRHLDDLGCLADLFECRHLSEYLVTIETALAQAPERIAWPIATLDADGLRMALAQDIEPVETCLGRHALIAGGAVLVARSTLVQWHRDLSREAVSTVDLGGIQTVSASLADLGSVPLNTMLARITHGVVGFARQAGKYVADVDPDGDIVPVDPVALAPVVLSLWQVFRFAVEHSVETPELRRKAGKADQARIACHIADAGPAVWLTITDDGVGLDDMALVAKAIHHGIIKAEDAVELDHATRLLLLTRPGHDGSDDIAQIFGRTLGLPATYKEVRRLGGTMAIESTPGQGTRITLRLPHTAPG